MECLTVSFVCNQCTIYVYMCVYTQTHAHVIYRKWEIRLSLLKTGEFFPSLCFQSRFLEVWLCL